MRKRVAVAMVVALAGVAVASAQSTQRADTFGTLGSGGLTVDSSEDVGAGRHASGDDDLHGRHGALVRPYR